MGSYVFTPSPANLDDNGLPPHYPNATTLLSYKSDLPTTLVPGAVGTWSSYVWWFTASGNFINAGYGGIFYTPSSPAVAYLRLGNLTQDYLRAQGGAASLVASFVTKDGIMVSTDPCYFTIPIGVKGTGTWQSVIGHTIHRAYVGALSGTGTWRSDTNPQYLTVVGDLEGEATWQSDTSIVIHTKTTISSQVLSKNLDVPVAKTTVSSQVLAEQPTLTIAKDYISSQVLFETLDLPTEIISALGLGQDVGVSAVYSRRVSDALIFVQQVIANGMVYGDDELSVGDSVGLSVVFNRAVVDAIGLAQQVNIAREFHVVDAMTLGHAAGTVIPVVDALVLSDSADQSKQHGQSDALGVSDHASAAGSIFHRTVVDAIGLTQGVFGSSFQKSVCAEAYHVVLGTRTKLTLTYPYLSPSITLDLRNPKFGNSDSVITEAIFRRTNGNQLIAGKASTWPLTETLKYSFEALTQAQRDSILLFSIASAGAEIGLLDHENRQWRGVIVSPQIQVEQRSRTCDFLVSFEFRGALA